MEQNNKKNDLNFDTMKDHLRTSFEMDNITVSEDLIARTLQAINKDNATENSQQKDKKKYKFPIYRIVGVAAVVLILFVSINVLQNISPIGMKKSSKPNDNGLSMQSDTAATSEPMEIQEFAATESAVEDNSADRAFSAEMVTEEAGSGNPEAKSDDSVSLSLFSGQYLITADQVISFSIENSNQEIISLSENSEKVQELFTILAEYPESIAEGDISELWNYKVKLDTVDGEAYTFVIGNDLQVLKDGDEGSIQEHYSIEDTDTLIKRMDEFYLSLK